MRAEVTHGRVERIDDVQQPHATRTVGELNFARRRIPDVQRVEREVWRALADAELVPRDRQLNVALERLARSNRLHGCISPFRRRADCCRVFLVTGKISGLGTRWALQIIAREAPSSDRYEAPCAPAPATRRPRRLPRA